MTSFKPLEKTRDSLNVRALYDMEISGWESAETLIPALTATLQRSEGHG